MNNKKLKRNLIILASCCIAVFLLGFTLTSCSSSSGSGGGSGDISPLPTQSVSPSPTATATSSPSPSPYPTPQPTLPTKKVTVGTTVINSEIADSENEQHWGLSWRPSLGENDGMLFVYDPAQTISMWMYGMFFNLDVIWIKGDEVVKISEDVPAPADPYNTDLPSYSSGQLVNYFLEVNAGFVEKHGIKTGDKITIE